MNRQLIILGAGGHGRVCAEVAELNGYQKVIFLDDKPVPGLPVAGTLEKIPEYIDNSSFFVAIGNNRIRKEYIELINKLGGDLITLIHPHSFVSKTASFGKGSVIMAGAVVQADAYIGSGVIINTCSSVDHDCHIGDYSHVAVGAHLAGAVLIGESTFIGASCAISNNLSITGGCIIGAGTAIIHDIKTPGTYVGVPARRVK